MATPPAFTDPPQMDFPRSNKRAAGRMAAGDEVEAEPLGPAGATLDRERERETRSSVTVMNDSAYPLIIAHSGAERGPLIKMS